ncbi:hypothetical protein, partial [Moorena sp. SIO3H5]|uniref:hypothetical protein n=1 Tax=Moorena sp. SIO3H5 TaxID=2607834 RepID=UPI0025E012A6
ETGKMPVSCLFSCGQDAHSTPIHYKTDATAFILLLITICVEVLIIFLPYSLLPAPYSLFPIPFTL